jgi:class 3 adenylate cyclase
MKKTSLIGMLNYVEENSNYCRLLQERNLNPADYERKLALVTQAFGFLDLPAAQLDVFANRKHMIVQLGAQLIHYGGFELPLYIGHRKNGLPIPAGLAEKCPAPLRAVIDQVKPWQHLHETTRELNGYSFTPEVLIAVHRSLMNARLEGLLVNVLSDIERLGFTRYAEAKKKIPALYLDYLTPPSLLKLVKKVAYQLREMTAKLNDELKGIDLYSLRLKEQMNNLYQETNAGLQEILQNEVDQGADIDTITKKISNLFSRLERLFLGNIYHLKDYGARREAIQQFFAEEEELKYYADKRQIDKRKKLSDLFEEYLFFKKFGPLAEPEEKQFVKNLTQEFEEMHRQKSKDLTCLKKFERKVLLGMEIDFDAVRASYDAYFKDLVIPQCVGENLLDLVFCLPPRPSEPVKVITDLANFRTLALRGDGILEHRDPASDLGNNAQNFIEAHRRCISVLVYDIRGSSYMGVKLHNALKEQRIKYKFAKEMSTVAKKYGGFLLKDTGDGGIIWFSDNSGSLYDHLYAESTTGKGMNLRYSIFSGAEFELIPALDSAKRAALCARDMIIKAEEFIQANFMHYREWFAEVTERTLEVDGITYALLPPEFKSLFRIGVGIASGVPDRDVVFAANSFGDPDLIGPILADAHLYSRERQPGRSVIICDLGTVINLLLNIENFDYGIDEPDFTRYLRVLEELRKMNHPYKLTDYKFSLVPRGIHILEELSKQKSLSDHKLTDIYLDDLNQLYNEDKKKIKPIYEIMNG